MLPPAIAQPLSLPSSIAPCTLAGVKAQLPEVSGSSYDARLNALIRSCAHAFAGERGLQRDYARLQWRVRLPGQGGTRLPLPVWPIESVSLVTEGTGSSPATIDSGSYEIVEPDRRELYRLDGWLLSQAEFAGRQVAGEDPLDYAVTCYAGWLMPGEVTDWSGATSMSVGKYVRPTAPGGFVFQVTSGSGNTGSTEPTWPTSLGGTVVDGPLTWTAVAARRLPDLLEEAAVLTVTEWFRGAQRLPVGVTSVRHGSAAVDFDVAALRHGTNPIPPAALSILEAYR